MKFLKYWGPVVVWMAIIFALSTRQRLQLSEQFIVNFIIFKFFHLVEYFTLYVFVYRAIVHTNGVPRSTQVYLYAFIIVFVYGISDEIHQSFVPTREGKIRDVIIDGIGAIIAWISIALLLPRMPTTLQRLADRLEITTVNTLKRG